MSGRSPPHSQATANLITGHLGPQQDPLLLARRSRYAWMPPAPRLSNVRSTFCIREADALRAFLLGAATYGWQTAAPSDTVPV